MRPLVSLSRRCTMPGRSSPPVEESAWKRWSSALTRVPRLRASSVCAGAGMDHHAGGLVDYGQIRVFIDDVERNVLRRGLERRGMRLAGDDDLFAAAQLERGFGLRAIDEHVALIDQQLHARAADAFKLRGEEVVEALACGLRRERRWCAVQLMRMLSTSCRRSTGSWQRASCSCNALRFALDAAGAHRPARRRWRRSCGPSSAPLKHRAAAFWIAPEFRDVNGRRRCHQARGRRRRRAGAERQPERGRSQGEETPAPRRPARDEGECRGACRSRARRADRCR